MQMHLRQTEDAPDPRKLNRHILEDLANVCPECLERDPNSLKTIPSAILMTERVRLERR
jgi:hypothetical protein